MLIKAKKVTSVLLAACMLFSLLKTEVFAENLCLTELPVQSPQQPLSEVGEYGLSRFYSEKVLAGARFEYVDLEKVAPIFSMQLTFPDTIANTLQARTQVVTQSVLSNSATILSTFPDQNLAQAVALVLGRNANNTITQADLDSIDTLFVEHRGIRTVEGIQYLRNLTQLDLTGNLISDASVLTSLLLLEEVWLSDNQLLQLNLTGMHNLWRIEANGNQIRQVNLNGISNLVWLDLRNNYLSQISLTGSANLGVLDLSFNQIHEIDLTGARYLYWVNLQGNHLHEIDLTGLNDLWVLHLDYNQLTTVDVSGLDHLDTLGLNGNQIDDLNFLNDAGLHSLRILALNHNQISDISPISQAGLDSLWWLRLADNQISDISALSEFRYFYILELSFNRIKDIRPLVSVQEIEFWICIDSQYIQLTPINYTNPLIVENQIRNIDGTRIVPQYISDGGRYIAPNVTWYNVGVSSVYYLFEEDIALRGAFSDAIGGFSGIIIQPLPDMPQPPRPMPFVDVAPNNWFYKYVDFVFNHDLMIGTTSTTFSPNVTLSRAMVATILYRMAGEPEVAYMPIFSDVAPARWYSNAVIWAFDVGIVKGIAENTFAPTANTTREQVAAMMHRYARYMGYNLAVPADFNLSQFKDHSDVSEWAKKAMQWTAYNSLIVGVANTTLDPRGTATRAQSAAILMRFAQTFR